MALPPITKRIDKGLALTYKELDDNFLNLDERIKNVSQGQVDLSGFSTDDIAEGDNLYFTTARANNAIDARVTKSFVTDFNITTSDIGEGSRKYWTTARGNAAIDARVTKSFVAGLDVSTDDLVEGSNNRFFTGDRVINTIDDYVTKEYVDNLNINADHLDGLNSSQFLRSDTADALNVGRGHVYIENHSQDNADGAGITLRTSSNPDDEGGAIFAVRSSGDAVRLWVGQKYTTTGDNEFRVGTSSGNGKSDPHIILPTSGDPTVGGNKIWHEGNGGAGSGLDADKLDSVHAWQFIRSDTGDTVTGPLNFDTGDTFRPVRFSRGGSDTSQVMELSIGDTNVVFNYIEDTDSEGTNNLGGYRFNLSGNSGESTALAFEIRQNDSYVLGNKIWHEGNVGPGSGLNADTIDGLHASQLMRSDASNDLSGDINISNGGPQIKWIETDTDTTSRVIMASGSTYFQAGGQNGSNSGVMRFSGLSADDLSSFVVRYGGDWQTIWHSGNGGSGSGLDADKLDGYHASGFLKRYEENGYIDFGNNERDDFNNVDGRLYFDSSVGLYIAAENGKNHGNAAAVWSSANFTAGSDLSVSYDGEDLPTLSVQSSVGDSNNTLVKRNGSSDIYARLFRSTYNDSGSIDNGAAIIMRNESSNDNYMRSITPGGFMNWFNANAGNLSINGNLDVNNGAINNIGRLDFGAGDHAEYDTTVGLKIFENGNHTATIGPNSWFLNRVEFEGFIDGLQVNAYQTNSGRPAGKFIKARDDGGMSPVLIVAGDGEADDILAEFRGSGSGSSVDSGDGAASNDWQHRFWGDGDFSAKGRIYANGGNEVWHTGNDGNLNADTVDNHHAWQFLRSDTDDTMNGELYFNGSGTGTGLRFGGGAVSNDYGGIRLMGGDNTGYLEFWTSDDYAEPFVFRSYNTGGDGTGDYRNWVTIEDYGIDLHNNNIRNVNALMFNNNTGGDYIEWETTKGLRFYENGSLKGRFGSASFLDGSLNVRGGYGVLNEGGDGFPIGSIVMARNESSRATQYDDNIGGSAIRPCNAFGNISGSIGTGTWRCLGYADGSGNSTASKRVSLYVRIS